MMKKKDNLTDLIERLPKDETENDDKPSKNQQVMASDGEMVTLGHKPTKRSRFNIHGKSLELIRIEKIVKETIEQEFNNQKINSLAELVAKKVLQKLKEQGLL